MSAPSISLAVICGNVAHIIDRFLRAFAPLTDEIVLVRAIGAQEPDATLDIAGQTISGINTFRAATDSPPIRLITAEYLNHPAHLEWPHVDDFAAARQKSFDLTTRDWIMWADTDDIITPETVAGIHKAMAALARRDDYEKVDAVEMLYDVQDDGFITWRERICRRGRGRWVFPIHENHAFEHGPYFARFDGAVILHAPTGTRAQHGSDERNARILRSIPESERSISQRFHLFQSLRALGRIEEAIPIAESLLKDSATPPVERYELLVGVGQLAEDPQLRREYYLQAVATDPTRREALGELVTTYLNLGDAPGALGWAEAMLSHPPPRVYPWNARRKYYGWLGVQIQAMALRANGHMHRADAIQFNHFIQHGRKISLLHATRGRSRQAMKGKFQWLDKASDPDSIEHIFAFDSDDTGSIGLAACQHIVVPAGGRCIRAWNAAAAVSHGQVLIQMSDDWEPPLHWDRLLLDRLGDLTKPSVLAISDGHRTDRLLCMAILTRARYQQQGHFLHPAFEEATMFSDNYFTDRAYAAGVVIEARDLIFTHHHPAFDHSVPLDETYARQNAPDQYRRGHEIYQQLTAAAAAASVTSPLESSVQ